MVRLEWLFLMQIVIGILMFMLLRKQIQMKKQVDEITREVMQYVSYIVEEEEQKEEKSSMQIQNKLDRRESQANEEDQNRLIQAVLGEYFP